MQKLKTKKFKKIEIKIKKILFGDFFGDYKTFFKGSGIDFSEIREYVFGDSIKRIDWKSTAKQNKFFIKNYEQEKDLKVVFFLDIGKTMNFGAEKITKKDLLVQIFYLLALSAIKSGNNVGVILFDENKEFFIEFSKSEEIIIKTLKKIYDENFLKNLKVRKKTNYVDFLKKYNLKDCLIFILTDSLDYDKKIFKSLDFYNEITYINIFDFFENNLDYDLNSMIFSNSKKFFEFSFFNRKKIDNYRDFRKNKIKDFEKKLQKNNINYINIDTKDDFIKKLIKNI